MVTNEVKEYMDCLAWCKNKGLQFTKGNHQEMLALYRNRHSTERTENSRRSIKGFDLTKF